MTGAGDPMNVRLRGGSLSFDEPRGGLRILRLLIAIRETSAPYNQFTLPLAEEHDITLCAYFPSDVTPPAAVTVFEGDGSLRGFFRVLGAALDAGEYDVVHAHSPHVALFFLLATLFDRRAAGRSVVTVHDSYQNLRLRNRLLFLPVFAGFRRVVCCGRASFESFPALYRWLAGDRMTAVQNGLDIPRVDRIAASVDPSASREPGYTVVAISRLVEIKNPSTLLTAFRLSADRTSRLLYIGDGPLRERLEEESRSGGLSDRIELTGLIPRERVFEHLLGADLFVSTSYGEGLPVAVLEAMACGCPVVLSDIPPHREIAEGVDFIPLVEPDDATEFARQVVRFREMPAADRRAVGRDCRALVEDRFSMKAMHAGYEEVYARVADAGVRPASVGSEA